MPPGHIRALRLLHETFHRYSPTDRLHILGRYCLAPLLRTLPLVPDGSHVLDVGAGHGLWARLIAEKNTVVAIEPEFRKIANLRHPAIRSVCGGVRGVRSTFDVVAIFDVLYLMNGSARDELLRDAYLRVRAGGMLIIKDLDPGSRIKNAWDRVQETIAVRVLRLSKGEGLFAHDAPEEMTARIERAGFRDVQWRRIDRWYPHAHIVYTAKRL